MKLVSFAVVSFLAATVSAGLSAAFGNADYNVHRLEKRDPSEDMQKQLEEEIKQDWEHYKDALGTYQDMKNLEVELEAEVSEARFESESGGYTPEGEGSRSQQHDAAILSYKRQYKDTYDQYVVMMNAKEKLYKKVGEASALKENQKQLTEHNEKYPNDLWEVTPPTSYNKEILFDQVSDICRSMEEVYILKDELKAASKELYEKLMVPGPGNEILQKQYIKVGRHLTNAKETIWMKNVDCVHVTGIYDKLFGASK
ncbi:hypothetical protein BASA83_002337 [Batrachochytrium salamandrivorans]|nr:hypothetical protein BASA83_002337 [Batrachochytrium salamandrivorans]